VAKPPSCVRAAKRTLLCLSSKQEEALRLKGTKPIACGSQACVYERDDGKLVKVTTDASDVDGLQRGQGIRGVVKVHQTYLLRQNGQPYAYAVVVDRLRPSPGYWSDWFINFVDAFRAKTPRSQIAKEVCTVSARRSEMDECRYVMEHLHETVTELDERGIPALDDLHSDNVGIDDNGRVTILDVGTRYPAQPAADLLGRALRRLATRTRLRRTRRRRP